MPGGERGLTVLFVTHSAELAARAQHRLHLEDGEVRDAVNGPAGIRLDSVAKHYATPAGPVRAVDGITLEVEPGTSLAITGPSGCGKSTLLGLIAGLEAADRRPGVDRRSGDLEPVRRAARSPATGRARARVPVRQPAAVPDRGRERRPPARAERRAATISSGAASCSASSASPTRSTSSPTSSPAGSASASRSRARSSTGRAWSSPTSRPARSTQTTRPR